jgi:hypothetical protein
MTISQTKSECQGRRKVPRGMLESFSQTPESISTWRSSSLVSSVCLRPLSKSNGATQGDCLPSQIESRVCHSRVQKPEDWPDKVVLKNWINNRVPFGRVEEFAENEKAIVIDRSWLALSRYIGSEKFWPPRPFPPMRTHSRYWSSHSLPYSPRAQWPRL